MGLYLFMSHLWRGLTLIIIPQIGDEAIHAGGK